MARLGVQGHTQEEGINYEEVFAPVARIEAIRLFLAYASYMDFTVYQMDVKSAFLYGTINEEVYVMQPPGFQDFEFTHRVYKVKKAMYGLHQALRAWYGTLSKYLLDNGFQRDDNVAYLLTKSFDVGRFQYLVGRDSGNSTNGLNRDIVVNMCLNFLHGSDSEQWTHEFMHIYLVSATAFCDYHNMVAILEKTKHNTDFHQIVDFLEASHIRVETTVRETKIVAKVNGRQRTVSESSIRRNLKLNDKEGGCSKHGGMDQGEDLLVCDTVKDSDKSADKGSDSTDDMSNVFSTLGDANILASGDLMSVFTTASLSVATASTVVSSVVATASRSFPTTVIFTTASVATPTTRVTRSLRGVVIKSSSLISVNIPSTSKKDKRKRKMTKPKQPSKEKVLEQMSAQLARDLEAKFTKEDQIIREQAERDSEIARIHAERELEMSNEIVAKYLSEYEQAEAGLSHDEKVELIDELIILEKMQDFVPMNSKLESERLKRPRIQLGKESFKKLKTAEASGTEPSQEQQSEEPKELYEEELKKIMELVPVEEFYIKALQRLYDTCGVHHVSTGRGHEIFMLVDKDYLLTKGLTTLMMCNKLQVDQYSK
nr:copia protein [Tanacetum cinerariifolium]